MAIEGFKHRIRYLSPPTHPNPVRLQVRRLIKAPPALVALVRSLVSVDKHVILQVT